MYNAFIGPSGRVAELVYAHGLEPCLVRGEGSSPSSPTIKKDKMNIVVCGLTASGKSFQSKLLAKNLGFQYVCASDILLTSLHKEGLTSDEQKHFWIKEEFISKIEKCRKDQKLDIELDRYILKLCNSMDNTIFESRTLPWLSKNLNLLKIFLYGSLEDRALIAYASKEEKAFSEKELKGKIDEKDQRDIERFKKLYHIDISQFTGFDFVLNNGKLSPEQTQKTLLEFIKKEIQKRACIQIKHAIIPSLCK